MIPQADGLTTVSLSSQKCKIDGDLLKSGSSAFLSPGKMLRCYFGKLHISPLGFFGTNSIVIDWEFHIKTEFSCLVGGEGWDLYLTRWASLAQGKLQLHSCLLNVLIIFHFRARDSQIVHIKWQRALILSSERFMCTTIYIALKMNVWPWSISI